MDKRSNNNVTVILKRTKYTAYLQKQVDHIALKQLIAVRLANISKWRETCVPLPQNQAQ